MSDQDSRERVLEPQRERDVVYDVDVAVAGGGVAGVFAALGAARQGADTVLIDRFGYPGGNMGPGMINAGGISPKDVTGPSGRPAGPIIAVFRHTGIEHIGRGKGNIHFSTLDVDQGIWVIIILVTFAAGRWAFEGARPTHRVGGWRGGGAQCRV